MYSEETRQKIVKSATGLFMEHGCKRITMDDIAGAMHISKRTLYEYFERKEDLLVACFESMAANIDHRRQELVESGTSSIVLLLYMFRRISCRNYNYALVISDTQRYYPEIYNRFFHFNCTQISETFHDILEQAQKEGKLRSNVDIDTTHSILMHFFGKMTSANKENLNTISESGFTFVRGLLSLDTISQFDQQEQIIRNIIQ